MSLLVLTSPDLLSSPLTRFMAEQVSDHLGPSRIPISEKPDSAVSSKLIELHNRLLNEQQKTWYQLVSTPNDLLRNNDYVDQLNELVAELAESSSFMINDPLLCFFLPLWEPLDELPTVAFHYSHPLDCAIDLQDKWRFPLSFGLALWESYVLAACKNIANIPHVLISASKLRNSGVTHLRAVSRKLADQGETELSTRILETLNDLSVAPKKGDYSAEQSACLHSAQLEIFELLEKGSLKSLAQRNISFQSADVLEKYGQLRAGFELTQKRLSDLQAELTQVKQQKDLADKVDIEPATILDHSLLSQVTVHLRDIPSLQFHCEADAPVLDMLREHLVNNTHNEMLYLNCGDSQSDEAVYFMSEDLLSIEIESVTSN